VRSKCGASAEQVRSKCGASAEQVRSKCGASAEQVRSKLFFFYLDKKKLGQRLECGASQLTVKKVSVVLRN
jgi:hypothetical protein